MQQNFVDSTWDKTRKCKQETDNIIIIANKQRSQLPRSVTRLNRVSMGKIGHSMGKIGHRMEPDRYSLRVGLVVLGVSSMG